MPMCEYTTASFKAQIQENYLDVPSGLHSTYIYI